LNRIKHTYILEDPYDDPPQLPDFIPEGSPEGKPKDEVRVDCRTVFLSLKPRTI
jgi:peptidyl-prolyl cis-trans isomerase-like 4